MKEEYATYEQAIKLKELGFKDKCNAYYWTEDKAFECTNSIVHKNSDTCQTVVMAPSLWQAQKWLRDKGMFLMIDPRYYQGDAINNVKWCFIIQPLDDISGQYRSECYGRLFDSYESALSAGIEKALELLTDNQNGK